MILSIKFLLFLKEVKCMDFSIVLYGCVCPLVGVISATLILICLMAFVLWRRSRHKGSYVTHEMDNQDDDDDDDDGDEDDDNDSGCSDTELQHEVPLEKSVKD